MAQFACYMLTFVHEIGRLYPDEIGGKDMKNLQELLIILGFPKSAHGLFESWLTHKTKASAKDSPEDASGKGEGKKKKETAAEKKAREKAEEKAKKEAEKAKEKEKKDKK